MRIALIPVFVIAFYLPFEWSHLAATLIFCVAAITDWFDGYLARRMNEISRFGAFLDPVADKLMVAASLVLIVDANPVGYSSIWTAIPAIVIIGREIAISALREWMAEVGASSKVAVSMMGKVKTTAQMVAIVLLLFQNPLFGLPIAQIGLTMLYISAILTLWSMVKYLQAARSSMNV